MSSPLRKMTRAREQREQAAVRLAASCTQPRGPLAEIAKDLAQEAARNHHEGVQRAAEVLKSALAEGDAEAKKIASVAFRNFEMEIGYGTIVSIKETRDDMPLQHHLEVIVATKQDALAVTDNAAATCVGFTTKMMTIIQDEDDDAAFGAPLWKKSTERFVIYGGALAGPH